MDDPSARTTLIQSLIAGRETWDELLSQIPPERWLEPVAGLWTVKDLVAHVTWYEREMIPVLQEHAISGSEWWTLPHAERNRLIREASEEKSVDEIRQEAADVFVELMDEIKMLSEGDLTTPGRIRNLPYDWTLWQVLQDNTVGHYEEHMPDLRAWLNGD